MWKPERFQFYNRIRFVCLMAFAVCILCEFYPILQKDIEIAKQEEIDAPLRKIHNQRVDELTRDVVCEPAMIFLRGSGMQNYHLESRIAREMKRIARADCDYNSIVSDILDGKIQYHFPPTNQHKPSWLVVAAFAFMAIAIVMNIVLDDMDPKKAHLE